MSKIEIPQFEKGDYLETTVPYEWLYSHKGNRLEMKQLSARMAEEAVKVGIRNFVALFNEYLAALRDAGSQVIGTDNQTDFEGQELSLWCGKWTADDGGIRGIDRYGVEVTACPHPILPVRRLTNIDTGLEKVELAYRRGGIWRRTICDKSTISDARGIIKLSNFGVAVNSDNAKHLVKFLGEVESLNYDRIPAANSVGRLGWVEGYGFSPYVPDLVFDGKEDYRDRFECVRSRGSYDKWLQAIRSVRKTEGVPTRLTLAAAFASVLVRPCSCLPFLVHLWGGSETGKTVALMMAASVWADPEVGRFIQTFNSTGVGKELGASFYNSLPLMLDELQIIDGSPANRLKFQQMIYELAEGVGRARGRRDGGLQKVGTWRNCIMSTGEHPLIDANTAAGAANRTIEICCQELQFFTRNCIGNGKAMAAFLMRNYGFAGKAFVGELQTDGNVEKAVALQNRLTDEISAHGDVTDKQSASAALILTADALAEEWMFKDGVRLTVEDIVPFLITKTKMDQNRRALEFLHDQIAMNPVRFDPVRAAEKSVELWGEIGEEYIYIIKPQFDRMLGENGFNAGAFLGWARQNGIIRIGKDGKNTVVHRLSGGKPARCVWLSVSSCAAPEDESEGGELLPL